MTNSRKYWVHFRAQIGETQTTGEMGIARELPICDETDLLEIAKAIAQQLGEQGALSLGTPYRVNVITWTRFEEPSVLLARQH